MSHMVSCVCILVCTGVCMRVCVRVVCCSTVEVDKHLVCEPCGSANVVGGYDEENHQVTLVVRCMDSFSFSDISSVFDPTRLYCVRTRSTHKAA